MVLPFVTVSVWNYCNQNCSYCISDSHKWNYKGRFEIFRPDGCEDLNDVEIRERFGIHYYKEMCKDSTLLNAADVMDVDYLSKWLNSWRKDSVVHITGGEPLLRPDIEAFISKICETHKVVLYTNGTFIKRRPKLLSLPIFWHVTYHRRQTKMSIFRDNIDIIREKPHRICCVLFRGDDKDIEKLNREFKGYDFVPIWAFDPRRSEGTPDKADMDAPASKLFNLITPDGTIWPCNKCLDGLGSIYSNTFDEEKARFYDKRSRKCLKRGECSAYKTQICIEKIASKWHFFDTSEHEYRKKELSAASSISLKLALDTTT